MKSKYEIATEALKKCPSDYSYNLSKSSEWARMLKEKWDILTAAGIKVTKRQFVRAIIGPRDGYWTRMDVAEYIAARWK